MARNILIMLLNANPDSLGSTFFQATAAASMDIEVEIYFASRAVSLLRQDMADNLYPGHKREKSLYTFMQEAHRAGVDFYACGGALTENGVDEDSAIPELEAVRGSTTFFSTALADGVGTLTY